MAVAESLKGVTYEVEVIQPRDPMGAWKQASTRLKLDAMALVGDVLLMVQAEMFGYAAQEHQFCLLFNGQALPLNIPIHFAGITGGATLLVVPGCPPLDDGNELDKDSDADSLDDAILSWAAGS